MDVVGLGEIYLPSVRMTPSILLHPPRTVYYPRTTYNHCGVGKDKRNVNTPVQFVPPVLVYHSNTDSIPVCVRRESIG